MMFPEGSIFCDQEAELLKPGVAHPAIQATCGTRKLGVQVVPISLCYSQVLPSWGCQVQIRIRKPLDATRYCYPSSKEGAT